MGCLREMGLRRSKHIGDWRTHSTFVNKEEEFRQPLKGLDTVLERGLTLRSSGGSRKPGSAMGESEGFFDEPAAGRASVMQNIQIIRYLLEADSCSITQHRIRRKGTPHSRSRPRCASPGCASPQLLSLSTTRTIDASPSLSHSPCEIQHRPPTPPHHPKSAHLPHLLPPKP